MRASERYLEQADAVMRLAAKAANSPEREVYLSIAEGWRKLAAEADRGARHGTVETHQADPLRRREGG
jgi:hypothetical protein